MEAFYWRVVWKGEGPVLVVRGLVKGALSDIPHLI